ncbi:MAG: M56 family metallopeptidase [Alistipes sp.]|nr:M56 family metallopeptidase [Alistipes sp.]
MLTYFTYALQAVICTGLVYFFYKLVLEGKTGYLLCRSYLIGGTMLASAIPLLEFKIFPGAVVEVPVFTATTESYMVIDAVEQQVAALNPMDLMPYFYLVPVLFFIARIIMQVIRIGKYTRGTRVSRYGRLKIHESGKIATPFTFMHRIFIPTGLPEQEKEQILLHEATHASNNHSVELLLMEVIKAVLWFNPFVWIMRRTLEQVHEYQADDQVIRQGHNITNYQNLLFRQLLGYNPEISSGLASKTQKRLIMMEKPKPVRGMTLRAISILPLLAGMLLLFSFTEKDAVYIFTDESVSVQDNTGGLYYFIDKKEVTRQDVEKLDPELIEKIDMTSDSEIMEEYGKDETASGLILVTTRSTPQSGSSFLNDLPDSDDLIIILDGKEITKEEFVKLDPAVIENISILNEKSAQEIYGRNHAVIVNTTQADPSEKIHVVGYAKRKENSEEKSNNAVRQQKIEVSTKTVLDVNCGIEPVIVVDGNRIDVDNDIQKLINTLNEADKIESITVLKGEAAQEAFDSFQDVIVIETKVGGEATEEETGSAELRIKVKTDNGQEAKKVYEGFLITEKQPAEDEPFITVEQMPKFQNGGLPEFVDWLHKELNADRDKFLADGKLSVSFVIEKDGSLNDIKISATQPKEAIDAVMQALERSPAWTPGKQTGETVRVRFTIPVEI